MFVTAGPSLNVSPSKIEVNETGSFVMNCTAMGEPFPEVEWDTSWLQSEYEIVPIQKGLQLRMYNVSEEDYGKITCYGSNAATRSSADVNVVVNGKIKSSKNKWMEKIDWPHIILLSLMDNISGN